MAVSSAEPSFLKAATEGPQRMSGLTGRTAASLKPSDGPLWAVHNGGFLDRTVIASAPPHGRSEHGADAQVRGAGEARLVRVG